MQTRQAQVIESGCQFSYTKGLICDYITVLLSQKGREFHMPVNNQKGYSLKGRTILTRENNNHNRGNNIHKMAGCGF